MKEKRFLLLLLVCALVCGCLTISGSASTWGDDIVDMESLPRVAVESSILQNVDLMPTTRAYGDFSADFAPSSISYIGSSFNLNVNDTISYDCTYTPKNASVDFGFFAPDGYFYFFNCTSGSFRKTIRVDQRGSYTLAICNNSDVTVTVTGTVNY